MKGEIRLPTRNKNITTYIFGTVLALLIIFSLGTCSNSPNNLSGFKPLAGYTNAGVDVYIQGDPKYDHDPPRYEYTIIDPLVYIDGERWMMVRYADGKTDYVSRDTAVSSGLYYVKK